jgi:hypothetical protein
MQTTIFSGAIRAVMIPAALGALLAGCSNADDPYAKLENPPLVEARLHTVTLVSDNAKLGSDLDNAGYKAMNLPPNYPAADDVQAMLWDVPAAAVKDGPVFVFAAPGKGPNVRLVAEVLPPAPPAGDAGINRSFFRHVLGTDVPRLPEKVKLTEHARVQVWTYQIPNILEMRRKLRAAAIPVVTEPVAITTPYLGDQKSMSLRAPDGTIVELVEFAAQ